ncbi:MAG: energy transducer TonB [Bacteroidia bacterium]|nr:energy transducer TonB [Bacteroidia bacterium]
MIRIILLQLFVFVSAVSVSQNINAHGDIEAMPIGGKEQIEQVIQTQLTLPKTLLTPYFNQQVTVYFHLDSAGNAIDTEFDYGLHSSIRKETERLLKFMKYRPAPSHLPKTTYFITYNISTERYNKLFKQKNKFTVKRGLPADSSYVVHIKAEQSPDYYKNGEEGLNNFVVSEIEYPTLAVEKSIQGTVVLEFVVETNGYVTNIVAKQGVNGGCTEEAIRLIKLTRWQPAFLGGKLVRYKTTYPITFSLINSTSSTNSSTGQ